MEEGKEAAEVAGEAAQQGASKKPLSPHLHRLPLQLGAGHSETGLPYPCPPLTPKVEGKALGALLGVGDGLGDVLCPLHLREVRGQCLLPTTNALSGTPDHS